VEEGPVRRMGRGLLPAARFLLLAVAAALGVAGLIALAALYPVYAAGAMLLATWLGLAWLEGDR